MTAETDRHSDYTSEVRSRIKEIHAQSIALAAMQTQWNEGGYGDNLSDGVGANEGITKSDVGPIVFDVANALVAILTGGNGAAIEKML